MPDIIHLLPDAVANQIAAGEVVQRPASALKELLENAVDAGATNIKVIVKDAGKTLLQVIDNGCGMSGTDARMCFERHATSKIKKAEDLFAIRTLGFRGEAMASIAAIAQVELRTKRMGDETGISIIIEGAALKSSESCATADGTSVSVKNLFFNVPARRNFLKSNAAETKHIIDEFQRVALARPEISFSLFHDGNEIFNLKESNLRQRIANVFGANYNERLVPVNEETTILNVSGFVGKPEFAKRTRGEQYFFVNKRFVKDAYLNHAVMTAFEEMLPKDCFPSYFIHIDIDPSKIDVNIHPTKTEIKYEDERSVYAIMKAAVKQSLGKFSIMPTLDFEQEQTFNLPLSKMNEMPKPPSITVDKTYNPFRGTETSQRNFQTKKIQREDWSELYKGLDELNIAEQPAATHNKINFSVSAAELIEDLHESCFSQMQSKYIVVQKHDELLVIDQRSAHERVLYEKFMSAFSSKPLTSQQDMFPQPVEFTAEDFLYLNEMEPEIRRMGFDIREFGKNTFVIHGIPSGMEAGNEKRVLEDLVEQFKHNVTSFRNDKTTSVAKTLSKSLAVKPGTYLASKEIKQLALDLFKCENPNFTAYGKPVFFTVTTAEIEKRFT
ncbi:MAG TPA: DNA mismatch repair endonuclease MutL [Bacteroidia bacterium]|nr:DNA mismatch repair endonuclease MutL [Bacteroidia bacterium]